MKDDGGPAFPNEYTMSTNNGGVVSPVNPVFGLTVRDWFAAQALLAAGSAAVADVGGVKLNYQLLAAQTYQIADAMLAERAKP